VTALAQALVRLPHLRVGQLIENAVDEYRKNQQLAPKDDFFYIEDQQMADALVWYADNYGRDY
jgi:hypothetical protein